MTTDALGSSAIDASVLGEAADWLVRLRSGEATDEDRRAFERWRNLSPQHAAAFQRAEGVLKTFGQVPAEVGRGTLSRLRGKGRRRTLQTLGLLLVAGPAAWLAWRRLPWQEWTADYRTATGEQKTIDLADGTRLVLNTASAVNVAFTAGERRLVLLAGEILVTTGRDPSPVHRPFIVNTPQGTVCALGTRFSMRRLERGTHVAVFQEAVEVRPSHAQAIMLRAGEQAVFHADGVDAPQPVEASAALWEEGMLVARRMRLADLAAELARYRSGVVRCHPEVADMPVSGAFPLKDTDASLRLLEKTLPVRISTASRYWVTIERP